MKIQFALISNGLCSQNLFLLLSVCLKRSYSKFILPTSNKNIIVIT